MMMASGSERVVEPLEPGAAAAFDVDDDGVGAHRRIQRRVNGVGRRWRRDRSGG